MNGQIGHVRERKLGNGRKSYQAQYPHPHAGPGKRKPPLARTFATKREARGWLAEQHVRYTREPGFDPDRAKTPFPLLVERWKGVRFGDLQPRSQARYEQVLRTHLLPEFEHARVGEITRERVRDFLAALANARKVKRAPDGTETRVRRYKPGTVLKVRTTLSSIMAEAVERGMVTANPCHGITVAGSEPKKALFLTPREVAALAEAMPRPADRVLVYVAAYTGARAGELHALRRGDVDLLRGRITISRALKVWRQGVAEFGPTKSNNERAVDFPPEIRDMLAAHLAGFAPGGRSPDALVFTNPQGGPIHQVAWLRNHFKPARELVLPDRVGLRFHDLRHTWVSFLIAANVHPKVIQEQAGHASITTTMDRYGHVDEDAGEHVKAGLSSTFAAAGERGTVTPLRAAG